MSERWRIIEGDVRKIAPTLDERSFDGVLCDPPYELTNGKSKRGFMGKTWDGSGVSFDPKAWAEVLRVCKPGAHMLAFGGTRTMHRITCAIEDAGFQIRDSMLWLFASGFPKSLDVSKAIDKMAGAKRETIGPDPQAKRRNKATSKFSNLYGEIKDAPHINVTSASTEDAKIWEGFGTALKPSFEPIVLARAPLEGTIVQNVLKWGCGALAIDACRIQYESDDDRDQARAAAAAAQRLCRDQNENRVAYGDYTNGPESLQPYLDKQTLGRWPANVLLDEDTAPLLDAQSGDRPGMSGGGQHAPGYAGGMFGGIDSTGTARGDSGGASRFFFTSKASRADRDHGLEHVAKKSVREMVGREIDSAGAQNPRAGAGRQSGAANNHPTVKPTDLLEYLAKLILPPKRSTPRRLFVPFAGSGSEMIAALRAGWDEIVGVELEYGALARERLSHADVAHQAELFGT